MFAGIKVLATKIFQGKLPRAALVLSACLLLAAVAMLGKAHITAFTVSETDSVINPGTYTFPDGNLHIRNGLEQYTWTGANDPRLNGTGQFTLNGNIGKDMTGPMWGTFNFVKGNGTMDGVWTGYFDLSNFTGQTHISGHGGGEFEGLQYEADCVYNGPTTATCTGRLLDTK
jgi:hypothetical protein